MSLVKHGPGRPPKYGRASRAVTVTLPVDVLNRLATVHRDVGRAIVTVAERHRPSRVTAIRPAELARYGNHAVIVVTPLKTLKQLAGVELIPLGDGRALISLEQPRTIAQLELQLRDAIDRGVGAADRAALESVAGILRQARLARGVTLRERTIIVLEAKRRPRR